MKNTKVRLVGCIGLLAWMAMAPAQAAAPITQKESSQSIELGNLDEPDTAGDMAAPATASNSQAEATVARAPQTKAKAMDQDKPASEADSPVAKAPALTPMERYRDLKLQASSTGTTNPASARRYLKVDRASYMDSVGGVQ